MRQNRHTYTGNQNVGVDDEVQKVEIHVPPHLALLHVDSIDRLPFTTYSNPRFEINSEIIRRTVNKIAMSEITVSSNIPNLNDTNLDISFESAMGIFNVTLTAGFYTVPDLMTHIVDTLNTVTVASGLFWNVTNAYGNYYNIFVIGGTSFRFLSSSHIDRAEPLSGLLITENFIDQQFISADGQYTRYIDFVSSDFRESQILENLFTKDYRYNIINHFYRYNIIQSGDVPYTDKVQIKNLSYSSVRSKEKNIITMQLYNQFGDLLFSPVVNYGGESFNIDIFKYQLKLSISA